MTTIGIISDTHNLLRPEAVRELAGCDLLVHAGDIGSAEIIDKLSAIAPVRAVRGNNDKGPWADQFPVTDVVEVAGKYIYVIHDVNELDLDPTAAGFHVVVSARVGCGEGRTAPIETIHRPALRLYPTLFSTNKAHRRLG